MVTIAEQKREQAKRAAKWEKENPGLSWCSPEYPEDDGKIFISKELLSSEAYRSLNRCSILIYQDFLAKRIMKPIKRNRKKVWVCENNGEIIYPYAEAEENGFTRDQFRNSIDQLQENGLLDITHQGKGGRKPAKGTGDVTRYWIDDRWQEWGTDDFKQSRNPRKKDSRKGRGWALYHEKKQT